MDHIQALEYINSRLRFGIKPGLERTISLLQRIGEPQRKLRFVHIAGTNGKGSTCTMTASALREAGFRTGLYTSPYITDFRERMQIDGQMISCEELARATEYVKDHIERGRMTDDDAVTEFELITCIAMKWFADRECDIVVLETGLGGRLDSTNIIESPLCTAITRIDLDHTAILGDTVEKIAAEKAGILKKGCPVVIASGQPCGAEAVIRQRAEQMGCPIICPSPEKLNIHAESIHGTTVSYDGLNIKIPLLGTHQTANMMTAVEVLRALDIEDKYIISGIEKARIPARLELLSERPTVLLDGAHNPNGAQALAAAVDKLLPDKRLFGVVGVLADKDYARELELLAARFERIFCCDGFSERCLSADGLAERVREYASAQSCGSPSEAFDMAYRAASDCENGAVIVFGSLYLAGAVRPYILNVTNNFGKNE